MSMLIIAAVAVLARSAGLGSAALIWARRASRTAAVDLELAEWSTYSAAIRGAA